MEPQRVTLEVAPHPAPFSKEVVAKLRHLLNTEVTLWPGRAPIQVLDPFAGIGGIHDLAGPEIETWGVELEPEWAGAHPATFVGDATKLPAEWTDFFHVVATSPAYANRMADKHEARDACKKCNGTGLLADTVRGICRTCKGTGLSHRRTYKHYLGRNLTANNSGGMQWGDEYRALHKAAWAEAYRVLKPGGAIMVNVKDHVRKGKVVPVTAWHEQTLVMSGFRQVVQHAVRTPGYRNGANSEARVDHEVILVARK